MDKYTHFTSPIRRYSDQIVHEMLNDCSPRHVDVNYLNMCQKRHKRYGREMAIFSFVFANCKNGLPTTVDAMATILPFRFSEKRQCFKIDLCIHSTQEFIYPCRMITSAQSQSLISVDFKETDVTIRDNQTGISNTLTVGSVISVRLHCSTSASELKKKMVITINYIPSSSDKI